MDESVGFHALTEPMKWAIALFVFFAGASLNANCLQQTAERSINPAVVDSACSGDEAGASSPLPEAPASRLRLQAGACDLPLPSRSLITRVGKNKSCQVNRCQVQGYLQPLKHTVIPLKLMVKA
jgi:hypothetical protein